MATSMIYFARSVLVGDMWVDSVTLGRYSYEAVHGVVRFKASDTDAESTVEATVVVPHSNVLFINTIIED